MRVLRGPERDRGWADEDEDRAVTGTLARWLEQTPVNVPVPDRAGARRTPAVMLQVSGLTSGEEEMEKYRGRSGGSRSR